MKNLDANALDYTESKYAERRRELSAILDSTNPDLSAFQKRGGKMIVAIGTNDTTAPPGEQLDYYKSVIDKMGRSSVDAFARLFVLPQTGHGLTGTNYTTDGDGKPQEARQVPSTFDRVDAPGRLGGKGCGARQVNCRHWRRAQPPDVLVSRVPQIQQGSRRCSGVLRVQRPMSRIPGRSIGVRTRRRGLRRRSARRCAQSHARRRSRAVSNS
jgi:hypothetical protein